MLRRKIVGLSLNTTGRPESERPVIVAMNIGVLQNLGEGLDLLRVCSQALPVVSTY